MIAKSQLVCRRISVAVPSGPADKITVKPAKQPSSRAFAENWLKFSQNRFLSQNQTVSPSFGAGKRVCFRFDCS
jgi:hypothetical protein